MHPSVRDLVWAMASPSLFIQSSAVVPDAYCQSVLSQYRQWWMQLDREPTLLTQWLERNKYSRLGIYFEHLIEFWLTHCIARGYLASHVRLYQGKQTLGELDFLFMSENQILLHWETAVKFYLYYQDENGNIVWYGPNAIDRLDIKLTRMKNHQLRLFETEQGEELLRQLHQKLNFDHVQTQAFVKGYLFYPLTKEGWNRQSQSPEVSPHHLRGWWCYQHDLKNLVNSMQFSDKFRWLIVSRAHWLAPQRVAVAQQNKLLQFHELQLRLLDHFRHSEQAVLVTQMQQFDEKYWREYSRGFVVAPAWPGLTSSHRSTCSVK